jgi:hypothetical protein
MAYLRFAWAGLADIDFLPDQDFGAAGFVKTDGMRHGITPSPLMTKIGKLLAEPARQR